VGAKNPNAGILDILKILPFLGLVKVENWAFLAIFVFSLSYVDQENQKKIEISKIPTLGL
jgi:hypothetical protein